MKLLLRITPMILVILGLFFMIGCEDTDDGDVVVDPLVGTWTLSNLEQSSSYSISGDEFAAYGLTDGYSLGSGGLVWAQFSAMGVNATVALLEDGTFTLDGSFPISSDTLGVAPTITPLTDAGVWSEDVTAGTLLIDGAFYDIGGVLTLSDDENTIALAYSSVSTDSAYFYVEALASYLYTAVTDSSTTELGFTK
ncbi:MAG: hypothetical protein L3J79_00225 [Candidatus Marinimicrobia bacterium]|nr:hypothetical protein [Candidatus Neomarinimicrobiota bacterium]